MKVPRVTTKTRCSHMNIYKKKINVEQTINRNLLHLTLKDQREITVTIPFATVKKKYLGINIPKKAKDLYAESYNDEGNKR